MAFRLRVWCPDRLHSHAQIDRLEIQSEEDIQIGKPRSCPQTRKCIYICLICEFKLPNIHISLPMRIGIDALKSARGNPKTRPSPLHRITMYNSASISVQENYILIKPPPLLPGSDL